MNLDMHQKISTETRRKAAHERLRIKLGTAIREVMEDRRVYPNELAAKLKVSQTQLTAMIWSNDDVTLYDICVILDALEYELYPVLREVKIP